MHQRHSLKNTHTFLSLIAGCRLFFLYFPLSMCKDIEELHIFFYKFKFDVAFYNVFQIMTEREKSSLYYTNKNRIKIK